MASSEKPTGCGSGVLIASVCVTRATTPRLANNAATKLAIVSRTDPNPPFVPCLDTRRTYRIARPCIGANPKQASHHGSS